MKFESFVWASVSRALNGLTVCMSSKYVLLERLGEVEYRSHWELVITAAENSERSSQVWKAFISPSSAASLPQIYSFRAPVH